MWCVELKISTNDKHHKHSKHTKFRQNLRGSLQFYGDCNWAWNDPILSLKVLSVHFQLGDHRSTLTFITISQSYNFDKLHVSFLITAIING